MFKAKLANDVVNFGHIKVWQYKAFQEFCLKHNFVAKKDTWMGCARQVQYKFRCGYTYNNAAHLPLGWVAVWISDFLGRNVMGSQQDYVILQRHMQKDPEYDYVLIRNDLPFAI